MLIQTEFSVSCVRPESSQLFFIFTGTGLRPAGVHTMDVVDRTAIGNRNIVILKDPYGGCYERGFSDDYASLDGILRWLQEEQARHFPHVRDVFTMGTSCGGLAAIQAARHLGARAAWSFSGRLVKPEVIEERLRVSATLYQDVIGRTRLGELTDEEQRKLDTVFGTPEMKELRWRLADNPSTIISRALLHEMVADVKDRGSSTDCHLYYVTSNAVDRECSEAFRDCANVNLHPVTPEPVHLGKPVGFTEPDHSIIPILYRLGRLPTLFADYL